MDVTARLTTALADRYRLERELGQGGMATVYLAEDLKHDRQVAIKVLRPELAAVLGAERFVQEIKTTAALSHPHILPLFDSGEADGFLFYVMPYLQGETIREKLNRETQFGVEEAVRITTEVAEALDYAHRNGVIHRDIKPENILLHDGRAMVMDFGIALAVSAAAGGRMTETGLSLGTPHYMSPEQATADKDITARSDIYSLASVLYEMLAGDPPHTASSAQAIIMKIVTEEATPVTTRRKSVPPNVVAAVAKALEKLPADRFTEAHGFARALADPGFRHGEVAKTGGPHGRVSAGPWNRLAIVTTSLAAVLTLALAWSLLRPAPPQPVTRQVLSAEDWAGLIPEFGRFAALAPDGSSMILPTASAGGAPGLGLKLRGSTEVTPIPGTEGVRDVVYAPDGEWIAYALGSDIYKRPLIGGSAVQLAEDASANARVGLAWLDDGTILYDVGPELFQISQDGGVPLAVVTLPSAVWVHGLPGASGALVVTADNELHVVDLGDQSSEVVLEEVRRAWYAPTGHVVYVRTDGAVFAQPFDLGSLAVTGGAVPLFDGVRLGPFIADMRLGADGTVLYVEGTTTTVAPSQLIVVDLEGNAEALALAPRPFGGGSVGWSPDGASIAFRSGWQIYTYNTVLNTTPRQLTFERINFDPTFSPDGMRVAFTSVGDGTNGWDLFVKDLNDDTPPRPIITLDGNQRMIGWPADTLILFENQSGNSSDLWIVDISVPDDPETRAYLTSEADLTGITVSPDGTLAAYGSNEAGTLGIYVRSFPTPGERTIVYSGAASGLTWSPDGGTLYAFTEGRDQHAIAIRLRRDPVPIVLGVDTLFTRPPGGVEPPPGSVLHPDGDRFILTRAADVPTSGADETQPDRLILVTNFFEELRQRTDGN